MHNAFTGAAKEMPITTRLPAILALGKFFGMSAEGAHPRAFSRPPNLNPNPERRKYEMPEPTSLAP